MTTYRNSECFPDVKVFIVDKKQFSSLSLYITTILRLHGLSFYSIKSRNLKNNYVEVFFTNPQKGYARFKKTGSAYMMIENMLDLVGEIFTANGLIVSFNPRYKNRIGVTEKY